MKLYTVGYGHNPSGKVYTYAGPDNYRTKQQVVVPVTHWRTKQRIFTMGTIMRSQNADGKIANEEAQRLSNSKEGIGLKWINGSDVFQLKPDGSTLLPSAEKFGTKKEWKEDSKERYDDKVRSRLIKMEV